jgi:hypothetical protein
MVPLEDCDACSRTYVKEVVNGRSSDPAGRLDAIDASVGRSPARRRGIVPKPAMGAASGFG